MTPQPRAPVSLVDRTVKSGVWTGGGLSLALPFAVCTVAAVWGALVLVALVLSRFVQSS